MNTEDFRQHVSQFLDGQTPRVWSFLVTVFGELTQGRNIQISGTVLSQICGEIGIKPEAMRVALHRLRKNGWIESLKSGRTSEYFLTELGRDETLKARPIIYATTPIPKQAWLCICNGPREHPKPTESISMGAQTFITGVHPNDPEIFTRELFSYKEIPQWMRDKICDPEIIADSKKLAEHLGQLSQNIPNSSSLTPLQTATLRILIVHSWRRIALKAPQLPDHLFDAPWAGPLCRDALQLMLSRLPEAELLSDNRTVT